MKKKKKRYMSEQENNKSEETVNEIIEETPETVASEETQCETPEDRIKELELQLEKEKREYLFLMAGMWRRSAIASGGTVASGLPMCRIA